LIPGGKYKNGSRTSSLSARFRQTGAGSRLQPVPAVRSASGRGRGSALRPHDECESIFLSRVYPPRLTLDRLGRIAPFRTSEARLGLPKQNREANPCIPRSPVLLRRAPLAPGRPGGSANRAARSESPRLPPKHPLGASAPSARRRRDQADKPTARVSL